MKLKHKLYAILIVFDAFLFLSHNVLAVFSGVCYRELYLTHLLLLVCFIAPFDFYSININH